VSANRKIHAPVITFVEAIMSISERLKTLAIELPPMGDPMGNYVHAVRTGNLLFLAGKGPYGEDGVRGIGKVGGDVTVEQAYKDARSVGLVLISAMAQALEGDLERVVRIVKVLGMVNGTPDFGEHPKVINGCSDLFVEVFGDKGRHARSAVGMGSLPGQITVEIEVIVEVR
jgi:enamine deaminase RidA (YjgF/YER057c/UK114 family)